MQTMHDVLGPVTIVTGKARRLTIIECPCDMNAMIDLSKVMLPVQLLPLRPLPRLLGPLPIA